MPAWMLAVGFGLGLVAGVAAWRAHAAGVRERAVRPGELPGPSCCPSGSGCCCRWRPSRPRRCSPCWARRASSAVVSGLAARSAVLAAALGFGLLGLLDDLAGDGRGQGLRGPPAGHAPGVGSPPADSSCSAAARWPWSWPRRLAIGHCSAGCSSTRCWSPWPPTSATCSTGPRAGWRRSALLAFAAARRRRRPRRARSPAWPWSSAPASALLVPDLRERLMLGDAGANVARRRRSGSGSCSRTASTDADRRARRGAGPQPGQRGRCRSRRVIDRVPPLRSLDRSAAGRTRPRRSPSRRSQPSAAPAARPGYGAIP